MSLWLSLWLCLPLCLSLCVCCVCLCIVCICEYLHKYMNSGKCAPGHTCGCQRIMVGVHPLLYPVWGRSLFVIHCCVHQALWPMYTRLCCLCTPGYLAYVLAVYFLLSHFKTFNFLFLSFWALFFFWTGFWKSTSDDC